MDSGGPYVTVTLCIAIDEIRSVAVSRKRSIYSVQVRGVRRQID